MYRLINVVKFNDQYFEHGDEVVVTKNDDSAIVGSMIINDREENKSSDWTLCLDVSEKYHKKTECINYKDIKNIQKVNN